MNNPIKQLQTSAQTKGYRVTIDYVSCNPEIWKNSNIDYPEKRITVYYYNKKRILGILAHEVGHAYTTNFNRRTWGNIVADEVKASQWGINTLKRLKIHIKYKRLYKFIVKDYIECLDTYKKDYYYSKKEVLKP